MQVKGWAHVCFLPPFDQDGNYETLMGHVVDEKTKQVYGLKGERLDYDDQEKNDCMDPQAFYRLILSAYTQQTVSLVVRRDIHNDMATLETDPADATPFDQDNMSFHFQPDRVLVDEKAYQHCEKYLPVLTDRDDISKDGIDWLVCLGSVSFNDGTVE
ncbi:uncharacterized protein BX664DRAFT_337176 [Halteromyces radiatus]|uniref:uncharacterized protein n=1 Tax=Halteromyces radiatus TaxID=101107 RepID=UPI00221E42E5|nr:uncharacterized protein BX664DRAFT_337176 [Halteromyces radiatus]KAI8084520.1 hypothetical protein BX664DRAFT_337176 [Halteromyces radiatus]